MIKNKLFRNTFWLLFFIGVLNLFATYLYFYWTSSWFDLLMHFLGGFWVAMVAVSLWAVFNKNKTTYPKIFTIVLWVTMVGVLWEVFELWIGATELSDGINFITDTLSDILMDILGGILGTKYSYYLMNTKNKND